MGTASPVSASASVKRPTSLSRTASSEPNGNRSSSWRVTPYAPSSARRCTVSTGSSGGRVASPNGSRACQPTVQSPKVNLSSRVGWGGVDTPLFGHRTNFGERSAGPRRTEASAGELEHGQPAHAGEVDAEQRAGQRLRGERVGVEVLPGGGDVEPVQLGTAEGARRDLGDGQRDGREQLTVRRVAVHRGAPVQGDPDAALRVDGQPVRRAGALDDPESRPSSAQRAIAVVENVDLPGRGVDVVG